MAMEMAFRGTENGALLTVSPLSGMAMSAGTMSHP
jgi:hypothetical protein